ncbi:MAG: gamma-glutamyl-gamma-aminobutyrate hydrolase family protein [Roseiflexus sp.]|nr:gamma-glutamyl-gamma-aminobutyrate hydrolase family protein [Roseiflexus sp.]MCS7288453.1 gamma-glutamyl-gamma-aminobutyrate hydrolase family protein [Roseiflexus sp.]MDW8234044.1 gamma-glutamyl-gamma-aminobutyrate hydrolase family protein [Roseiflexaceae bacterium]
MSHTHRPIIGVPCLLGIAYFARNDSWFPRIYGNVIDYLQAIEAAGGAPLLIHLTTNDEVLDRLYQQIDGLLLAGGEDINPAHYGAPHHPKLGEPDPLQDDVEIKLTRRALRDGKPVLAICRGIQLLNVALGGTLYQDIPSEVEGALNHNESTDREDMTYLAHPISIEPDSCLANLLGATEAMVNTLHHQALRDVAPTLRVTARAPDGIIEAVEAASSGWVVGVQCHPEMLWNGVDPRWARVFQAFVQAAGISAKD